MPKKTIPGVNNVQDYTEDKLNAGKNTESNVFDAFKSGRINVKIDFSPGGASLDDLLTGYTLNLRD
ncbi:MAG: hypothetical protein LBV27_04450 [Oscillospiraceae bacterium]|nr:hypothetical protein [Oscillospiraceae bacterium]